MVNEPLSIGFGGLVTLQAHLIHPSPPGPGTRGRQAALGIPAIRRGGGVCYVCVESDAKSLRRSAHSCCHAEWQAE